MSSKSKYSVLDNRPIDQWKVTELKEELKRRKLAIRGLKEDLVKRLDEALRLEKDNDEETDGDGDDDDPPVTDSGNNVEHASIVSETTKETNEDANKIEKVDDVEVQVEDNDSTAAVDEGKLQDGVSINGSPRVEEGSAVHVTTPETTITVTETVVSGVALSVEGLPNMESKDNEGSEIQSEIEESKPQLDSEDSKLQSEIEESKPQLDSEDSKPQLDSEDSKPQLESEESKPQLESEESKPRLDSEESKPRLDSEESKPQLDSEVLKPQLESDDTMPQLDDVNMESQVENENLKSQHADLVHNTSAPDDQVSEVSPVLGSQVRTDSISTDSVTINEMIELKENISADHVKLELDVKQEMVEPSSSIIVPDAGESHPMDVEEPPENKNVEEPPNRDVVESPVNKDIVEPFVKEDVEEKHDVKDIVSELHKKHDGVDVGFSEKLNLDRSSGDDSMEDAIENKTDSGNNPEEVGEKNVKNEGPISKEEKFADIAVRGSTADKKSLDIENDVSSLPAEKRKLHDQAVVGNNETVKRQRRWNAENLKIPESQNAAHTSTSNSKDIHQSTAPKRNFSRSDSTASEDPSKERVVPPSPKSPTSSLRIDRFLRPFTLKAVQELLGKTGSVTSFWMDHIKTHCYVTYSSVEEAVKTRAAVYNLQWPPNGGRLLLAEFVDPQEVNVRVEAPQTPTPAVVAPPPPVSTMPPPLQPEPSPRQPRQQQQLAPPPSLPPPPPPTNNLAQTREHLPLPPPPALPDKVDTPIVTLDDLFRKTKATPRIYYLPLSDEQVQQAKLAAARGKETKQ